MSAQITPGMIVTAGLADAAVPEGSPVVLYCEGSGTRRVVQRATLNPLNLSAARMLAVHARHLRTVGESLAGTVPIYGVNIAPWYQPGDFVGYDGLRSTEPVNQVPDFLTWVRHATTFAHEIDSYYADHTHQLRQRESYRTLPDMPHTDESNMRNQNALQLGRGACGYVFDKVLLYSKLPQDGGGSGVLATDWKMQRGGVLEDVEALCLTCPHPYWLRQFIVKHDVARWRTALDELLVRTAGGRTFSYMRCPKIDRSTEIWLPSTASITTFSGNAPLNWWKTQMVNWGKAVDYYDAHFARRD